MIIVGWILIGIGVLAFLGGLLMALVQQLKPQPARYNIQMGALDIEGLTKLLDSLTKLVEQFAKLSVSIQWALLGLGSIAAGVYLIR